MISTQTQKKRKQNKKENKRTGQKKGPRGENSLVFNYILFTSCVKDFHLNLCYNSFNDEVSAPLCSLCH